LRPFFRMTVDGSTDKELKRLVGCSFRMPCRPSASVREGYVEAACVQQDLNRYQQSLKAPIFRVYESSVLGKIGRLAVASVFVCRD
jgi:hypothetical protein